jgi:hypothetical protein
MKVWKIRQYLPALLLCVQRRVGSERGFLVAVRTRDICGTDRRYGRAVHSLMMRLKVAMFLTGSRTVQDLALAPRVYGPRLRNWIEQRRLHC